MINQAIIAPQSIAVIGGSNNTSKPGGKLVQNLQDGVFQGDLYVVNPRETLVQGVESFPDVHALPPVDLAILAVPPRACLEVVEALCHKKTRGFIIISAGFGESDEEGSRMEHKISALVDEVGGTLIGPNCIGVLNPHYTGVFTSPTPTRSANGCDLISSSGATAVFIMEAGIPNGLRFSSVFSVGNAAQTSVEDCLEYLDHSYVHGESAQTIMLYMESIQDSVKLIKHAKSLINKGARIAAIKAGSTAAGSRAAASHTGAIANSDMAARALFRKAGIVYCSSRDELIAVSSIFNYKPLRGKNIAIITHAGGSAVMLSDALSKYGLEVPEIKGPATKELLTYLHKGSSVANPIDFLATGTAEQLGIIIDYCEFKFDEIDAMIVVFGSSGLFNVRNVYDVLQVKLDVCKKPIYPVLPSLMNAQEEIAGFLASGHINFPDEVLLGTALGAVYQTEAPFEEEVVDNPLDIAAIQQILERSESGFLPEADSYALLQAAHIPCARQTMVQDLDEAIAVGQELGFPLALKVVGPLHKSDVKGVHLHLSDLSGLTQSYRELMKIPQAQGVLIQKMYNGIELFIGAKREAGLGHLLLFGLGGIFVDIFKDVRAGLVPLRTQEIEVMLQKLQAYPILQGARGKAGIPIALFIQYIIRVSQLIEALPEIVELDINPLIATALDITAVDVRIRIEKG